MPNRNLKVWFKLVPVYIQTSLPVILIQGKNVDPGFRILVRMTQLPRLPSPPAPNFEILYSKFRPIDLNLANLKQLNRTAILENHIALLYLSVIVMDFNSFMKVRQKPVYHNQLFMHAIFCLLC